MKYTLINRNRSTIAKNNYEFVRWMRKHDIQTWHKNEEFMEAYSHRKATFEKIILRFANEDEFVEDLQKNNLLRIEEKSPIKNFWNFF